MAKRLVILLIYLAGIFYGAGSVYALQPSVQAPYAILVDGETGEVLYQKNAWQRRPPASTTKILTGILALEIGQPHAIISVSRNAAAVGEASIGLTAGDCLSVMELVHGALLKSGNDACVALAESLCPSEEEFINLMNLKAKTLGALQTSFYNTNGLPHQKHLTTAYDLAAIARYAMKNPAFAEIVGKKYYSITWLEPRRSLYVKNTNKLLWNCQWAIGVKTGTTDKAGKCLVAAGRYYDKSMIAVLLNSPDRFNDAKRLLEYGFRENGRKEKGE